MVRLDAHCSRLAIIWRFLCWFEISSCKSWVKESIIYILINMSFLLFDNWQTFLSLNIYVNLNYVLHKVTGFCTGCNGMDCPFCWDFICTSLLIGEYPEFSIRWIFVSKLVKKSVASSLSLSIGICIIQYQQIMFESIARWFRNYNWIQVSHQFKRPYGCVAMAKILHWPVVKL